MLVIFKVVSAAEKEKWRKQRGKASTQGGVVARIRPN